MTDYMQKAREMLPTDYSKCVVNVATTLEALDTERTRADEAQKRERELREGLKRIASEQSFETDASIHPVTHQEIAAYLSREIRYIRDFARTLIQPEPDPLVEALKDCGYATLDCIEPEFAADLRTALAKHGLSIVKGESL